MVTSPRQNYRRLRTIPLQFDDPDLLLLAQALEQASERLRRHPVEVVSVTASYTMLDIDLIVKMDATDGDRTVFLPSAKAREGRKAGVKKIDSSANLVVIDPDGTETIDGSTTISLTSENAYREMVSDGTNWVLTGAIGNATAL